MPISKPAHSYTITIALTVCLLSPTAFARSTELIEPAPVTINCSLSAGKMREGIIKGGTLRGWVVVDETPGNVDLRYVKGNYKHSITVNVSYTGNRFAIVYKDSTNLDYSVKRDGTRRLHPRPIGWMKNLNGDIQMTTYNLCFE